MAAPTRPATATSNGSAATGDELRPVTVPDFLSARARGRRLTMLTAYDYTMARLLDAAGVDSLLVGDSLGMVVQGQPDSLAVTLEEMLYHTRLVARGEAGEAQAQAARLRDVRRWKAPGLAGAGRECARTLRAGRSPRDARVADVVAVQDL